MISWAGREKGQFVVIDAEKVMYDEIGGIYLAFWLLLRCNTSVQHIDSWETYMTKMSSNSRNPELLRTLQLGFM